MAKPMFTRRHYVAIANVLRENIVNDALLVEFAFMFKEDNIHFDKEKFYKAVMG